MKKVLILSLGLGCLLFNGCVYQHIDASDNLTNKQFQKIEQEDDQWMMNTEFHWDN